jgi:hypothetical protein
MYNSSAHIPRKVLDYSERGVQVVLLTSQPLTLRNRESAQQGSMDTCSLLKPWSLIVAMITEE